MVKLTNATKKTTLKKTVICAVVQ